MSLALASGAAWAARLVREDAQLFWLMIVLSFFLGLAPLAALWPRDFWGSGKPADPVGSRFTSHRALLLGICLILVVLVLGVINAIRKG